MSDNFSRRFFAGADAIGDADSVVRAAGEGEGGKLAQRSLDSFNERLVADVVLRHGVWVAPDRAKIGGALTLSKFASSSRTFFSIVASSAPNNSACSAPPTASHNPSLLEPSAAGMIRDRPDRAPVPPGPADFIWTRAPWVADLLPIPPDATWPRLMTGPHPRAVGSYGPELEAWSASRTGTTLRWWQRLAVRRILEHDEAGVLVWAWWIASTARQVGKSWTLRELNLWRIHQGDRFGEPQLVLHTGKDLPVCREVQRPARAWARAQGQGAYTVREANGMEEIETPDGSRWMIRGRGSVYGYSASLGVVDEAWKVVPEVVEDGLEPTMAERASAQLGLLSTAHRQATALVPSRREAALAQVENPVDTLLLEWSAEDGAALDDREAWRMASPHWTPRRETLVAAQHERAIHAVASDDPDEPDPVEAFRSQWLNIWATRATAPARVEPLLTTAAWAEAAILDWAGTGPLTLAIEDNHGRGAAAIAARRTEAGPVVVWGAMFGSRPEAWRWCELRAAEVPGSALLTGPGLEADVDGAAIPVVSRQPVGPQNLRHGLALLRESVAGGRLVHDGGPALTEQMAAVRVIPAASGGLSITGHARSDLIRAAGWAVGSIMRAASRPTAKFVIR